RGARMHSFTRGTVDNPWLVPSVLAESRQFGRDGTHAGSQVVAGLVRVRPRAKSKRRRSVGCGTTAVHRPLSRIRRRGPTLGWHWPESTAVPPRGRRAFPLAGRVALRAI